MKKKTSLVLGLVAAALMVAATVGVANAGQVGATGDQTFKNGATKECLDDSSHVRTVTCYGNQHQSWFVIHTDYPDIRILQNDYTRTCLGDYGSGSVWSIRCDLDDRRQWWRIKRYGDGSVRFQNVHYGFCIDDSYAHGLRMYPCHDRGWQRWY